MEIITVKDAGGVVLEKRKVTTVSIDAANGGITVQGDQVIIRKDEVEVSVGSSMIGFNIQPVSSGMPGSVDLTNTQRDQIMAAKDTFLNAIKTIIETKAQIV